ncbi:hypothetical protein N481_02200 [Pseudoalteromonas luteoviolacea S4047-1]|uniref:Uncharacterized protein n=1 Tax=Pseudoalteromonas luteoviolacea S4054 TaxID=1129367 RepID=A0A0F6A4K5_9GAMM|nr:hypothetical protein N479_23790 [Pseudoalteromonas luteoviolacea S4054]KZN70306.1 hypothetical protein N481_02200 [Pseudoalteromonas luteoviolacea S4047-1]
MSSEVLALFFPRVCKVYFGHSVVGGLNQVFVHVAVNGQQTD